MKKYNVVYSVSYEMEANSEEEAIEKCNIIVEADIGNLNIFGVIANEKGGEENYG